MIKKSINHLVKTALTLLKHAGVIGLLAWFFPVRWVSGQAMFMWPYFYNGYFSMRSINKLKRR